MKKTIVVPVDFSEVTENAIQHALNFCQQTEESEIVLLHIVSGQSAIEGAESKLQMLQNKYASKGNIRYSAMVGELVDMGKFAQDMGGSLIFMGTHGLKGFQYLVGSRAIKVVSETSIPFIIVQGGVELCEVIDEIVVPLDFSSEEKVILSATASLAKVLNARIHIIGAHYSDELLKKRVDLNLSFAKRYLKEKGVDFVVVRASDQKEYQEEILDYSRMVDAKLIAIINHHEDGVSNLLGKNFDQNIITNKNKIPVLMFTGKKVNDNRDIFMMFSN